MVAAVPVATIVVDLEATVWAVVGVVNILAVVSAQTTLPHHSMTITTTTATLMVAAAVHFRRKH